LFLEKEREIMQVFVAMEFCNIEAYKRNKEIKLLQCHFRDKIYRKYKSCTHLKYLLRSRNFLTLPTY